MTYQYVEEKIEELEKRIEALEQEPCDELDFVQPHKKIPVNLELCDDEYIKVPKKALKYRTAGMVAYNVEWLKNHFDIERAVICGVQEPCEDAISRILKRMWDCRGKNTTNIDKVKMEQIIRDELPPVKPTEKVGHWITVNKGLKVTSYKCSECGRTVRDDTDYDVIKDYPYCHCGAKMREGAI